LSCWRTPVQPRGQRMNNLLLHFADVDARVLAALDEASISAREIAGSEDLTPGPGAVVLLLTPGASETLTEQDLGRFADGGGAIVVAGPAAGTFPAVLPQRLITSYAPTDRTDLLVLTVRAAFREVAARKEAMRLRHETARRADELAELTQIGKALNTQRDYDTLLHQILSHARRLTSADAASLYLVQRGGEDPPAGADRLRFTLAQNASRPDLSFDEFSMPLTHASIAGHVALTASPLIIDDAYEIPPEAPYSFNRSIDQQAGYRTKSLLTVPMIDHRNEVIGVLQLINRKRDFDAVLETATDVETGVVPFSRRLENLAAALAGQAAVSIDNRQLIQGIEDLFENFVEASVLAIEQRDLPTRGHSRRVAEMTVALAMAVDRVDRGPYAALTFNRDELREIRYAGLLHDFGKVGVREHVLGKAKKLYEADFDLLRQRYGFLLRTAERDFYKSQCEYLRQHRDDGFEQFLAKATSAYERSVEQIRRFWHLVTAANEPTVLPEGDFEELARYVGLEYEDPDGERRAWLTQREWQFLTIRKGSLNEDERQQIQDHVDHTYRFLTRIQWTDELQHIPEIAWGHHEKLDGSGYPRRIRGVEILPQTRMMTIVDIYDALAAQDRPYKSRLAPERALSILEDEVAAGMLDEALFQVFVDAGIYQIIGAGDG
jgi:HD-GYP domain-containing protein (c-di-GMP phosphodiesterase class II)